MINYIEQYVRRPDVSSKLASMYPAFRGVPESVSAHSLEDAVAKIAANSYYQKKQAALIQSGLLSLKDIENG